MISPGRRRCPIKQAVDGTGTSLCVSMASSFSCVVLRVFAAVCGQWTRRQQWRQVLLAMTLSRRVRITDNDRYNSGSSRRKRGPVSPANVFIREAGRRRLRRHVWITLFYEIKQPRLFYQLLPVISPLSNLLVDSFPHVGTESAIPNHFHY